MKTILPLLFFTFFYIKMNAQIDTFSCYKWEGVSKEGHFIYGIAKTKPEAEYIIEDFNIRNARTQFKLSFFNIKKGSLSAAAYHLFTSQYPRKYRVLTKFDIAAMHIYEISNFDKAASYLIANSNKAENTAKQYLQQLLKEYKIYRLHEKGI
ncbi:hypothetical protein [Aquimarina agarilytica]|uniref:hypothetical protein n=1 Tax=Aquimarina agarilytica TaxID=1087449 RepID=UPI0012FCA238|nr:hypothetical protein [Aquimarina agarilytica]